MKIKEIQSFQIQNLDMRSIFIQKYLNLFLRLVLSYFGTYTKVISLMWAFVRSNSKIFATCYLVSEDIIFDKTL